jgi:methyltransferase-like protein/SAM-dependent methyltransferase
MTTTTPYDTVAYPGHPYAQTHPDHLATLATLHGMTPAPADRCRVLELGCGDGANLIPMALTLPESFFLGIDLAHAPVQRGQNMAARLGLSNIRLETMNLMDFKPTQEMFDYIIIHGLYSWVPAEVQKKVMAIAARALASQGVLFISYNTFPGGHIRCMIREMMLFHADKFEAPEEKIRQSLMLIQLIADAQNYPNRYGVLLQKEWEEDLRNRHPKALFHDELGDCNSNLYFHEFISQAAKEKLQFLCEAHFHEMQANGIKPHIKDMMAGLGDDIISREQYFDFLIGRRFRQTLLCHDHIQVDRSLPAKTVMQFLIASKAHPEKPVDRPDRTREVKFLGAKNACLTSTHPLLTAALLELNKAWPMPLHFETLWERLNEEVVWSSEYCPRPDHRTALAEALLNCFGLGLVELRLWRPPLDVDIGARPLASPLARLQSDLGDTVTTLLHTSVKVTDPLARRMLQLLDGTKDRPAIEQSLVQAVVSGRATLLIDHRECLDPLLIEQNIRGELENQLKHLARLGLLCRLESFTVEPCLPDRIV